VCCCMFTVVLLCVCVCRLFLLSLGRAAVTSIRAALHHKYHTATHIICCCRLPWQDLESRAAIVGPNGIGKSTLLGLISGALEPVTGHITRNPKVGRQQQQQQQQQQQHSPCRGCAQTVASWHLMRTSRRVCITLLQQEQHPLTQPFNCRYSTVKAACVRCRLCAACLCLLPAADTAATPQVRLATFSQHHVDGMDLALNAVQVGQGHSTDCVYERDN
jgi:energy-coupling factor transporter ATP-binding protein EcfA2